MSFDSRSNDTLLSQSVTSLTPEIQAAAVATVKRLAKGDEEAQHTVCAALGLAG